MTALLGAASAVHVCWGVYRVRAHAVAPTRIYRRLLGEKLVRQMIATTVLEAQDDTVETWDALRARGNVRQFAGVVHSRSLPAHHLVRRSPRAVLWRDALDDAQLLAGHRRARRAGGLRGGTRARTQRRGQPGRRRADRGVTMVAAVRPHDVRWRADLPPAPLAGRTGAVGLEAGRLGRRATRRVRAQPAVVGLLCGTRDGRHAAGGRGAGRRLAATRALSAR